MQAGSEQEPAGRAVSHPPSVAGGLLKKSPIGLGTAGVNAYSIRIIKQLQGLWTRPLAWDVIFYRSWPRGSASLLRNKANFGFTLVRQTFKELRM